MTVAPDTSTIRGLSTEVPVGHDNELVHPSVVSCDTIVTVPATALGRRIGRLRWSNAALDVGSRVTHGAGGAPRTDRPSFPAIRAPHLPTTTP